MSNELNDFAHSTATSPRNIDDKILAIVQRKLDPSNSYILSKLFLIHGFIGFITMTFCPQFNLSLTNNYELFHYFHQTFGEVICNIICGAIFFGTGAIFAVSILSKEETKKLKTNYFIHYIVLSVIFFFIFTLYGADFYLTTMSFWLLGAIGAGVLFVLIGSYLKLTALQTSDSI